MSSRALNPLQICAGGKKKLQPSDFMEIINYMTNMESANASAKEILVCRQLLLQRNLKTCCLKLREIARHIWWRESVLFPPSKEEGEKRKCLHYQVKICSHFHCWSFGSLFSWTCLRALAGPHSQVSLFFFFKKRHKLQHCIISVYIRAHML